ncbi:MULTISPECIES: VOC family protein [Pontibacillus]|uniref:VOC family protein n=1 Tax=Pontibacillus chungwhensis TaxID=265426 RepID=A0ABY8UWK8_9BACI|nr:MULTISPECIES: VOC family protein [Pontibacillus]MCD5323378.1 VOC family protein [Pontibacillus sp. HN14]WIF96759.1 VOC family protein [Pontibacillus chungwhensis]
MVPQRVSLLTIGAHDVSALRKFYQNLGWEETNHGYSDYAVFKNAGVMLSLYSYDKLIQGTDLDPPPLGTFKGVTVAINVDAPEQVDETIARVKEAGGQVTKPPVTEDSSFRSASFQDPEHNVWEVAYNPDSTFDEKGVMLSL